ncbi:hypothetical protein T440DRAFT_537167, partial [Plenodomus tracheiphilus IPT5]
LTQIIFVFIFTQRFKDLIACDCANIATPIFKIMTTRRQISSLSILDIESAHFLIIILVTIIISSFFFFFFLGTASIPPLSSAIRITMLTNKTRFRALPAAAMIRPNAINTRHLVMKALFESHILRIRTSLLYAAAKVDLVSPPRIVIIGIVLTVDCVIVAVLRYRTRCPVRCHCTGLSSGRCRLSHVYIRIVCQVALCRLGYLLSMCDAGT